MKKIAFAIALLLPLISFAQNFDYLHPAPDNSALYGFIVGAYILACIVVGFVANARGWEGLSVFVVAILSTPLVAAILYAPYKVVEDETKKVPNPIIMVKED